MHPPVAAAGRKGRSRPARDAAAAAGGIDVEAQQEVTVALSQKLPALLTQFQAEPAVVSQAQRCCLHVEASDAVGLIMHIVSSNTNQPGASVSLQPFNNCVLVACIAVGLGKPA